MMLTATKHIIFLAILAVLWPCQGQFTPPFDMIIAQDGSGDFTTITEGISSAPNFSSIRFKIKLSAGIYNENIVISKEKTNLMIIGEGMDRTIITGSRSYDDGLKTFDTATLVIKGDGFVAWGITFQNTAGPEKQQAVALLTKASYLAFYKCSIIGFQDTLYAKRGYQFFRECQIYGTVDFIFGDATVVFQSCNIYARNPLARQSITVTAQGREESTGQGGFVIHNCKIRATSELIASEYPVKIYLGRPWRDFARTVVMQSYLDSRIDPQGWLEFNNKSSNLDLYYAEYDNRGPGSSTYDRVKWKGFRVIDSVQAYQFTVREFIDGDMWIPATGVPYNPDFLYWWSDSVRHSFSSCKVFVFLFISILITLPI
ncbi:hypothetical protein PTKIN_Ptkin15bG0096500 [Pterospermum kingtungense]